MLLHAWIHVGEQLSHATSPFVLGNIHGEAVTALKHRVDVMQTYSVTGCMMVLEARNNVGEEH